MLWACLYFPSLALDVFARAWRDEDTAQKFVVASGGNAPKVIAANDAAREAGIRRGHAISAALALAPDVVLRDRDPGAEARAIAQLATWTLRFTPQVSIIAADALVLEIGGSLRLFGGLPPLVARISNGVKARGYEAQLGIAAVFIAQNKPDLGLPHLQKAVAINPQNEVAWYRLALVHRSLGNVAEQQKDMAEFKRLHESASQPILTREIGSPNEVTRQELDPASAQ